MNQLHMQMRDGTDLVPVDIREVSDFLEEVYPTRHGRPTNSQPNDTPYAKMMQDFKGELLVLPFEACIFESNGFVAETGFMRLQYEGSDREVFMVIPRMIGGVSIEAVALALAVDQDHISSSPFEWHVFNGTRLISIDFDEFLNRPDAPALLLVALICCYAAWLMGWKREVEIVPAPPSRQQRRFLESRNRPVPVGRVKLRIETWRKMFRRLRSESADTHSATPLHMVRGHRTIYTSSNPLFNCELCRGVGHKDGSHPHVGSFWMPAHVRGNKENGIIEHDYSVAVN